MHLERHAHPAQFGGDVLGRDVFVVAPGLAHERREAFEQGPPGIEGNGAQEVGFKGVGVRG